MSYIEVANAIEMVVYRVNRILKTQTRYKNMITTIATTLVTPFMVAAAPDATPAEQPQVVAYNWVEQKVESGVFQEDENSCGLTRGTFCYPNGNMMIDDWTLAE